jgi:hypothetical protein
MCPIVWKGCLLINVYICRCICLPLLRTHLLHHNASNAVSFESKQRTAAMRQLQICLEASCIFTAVSVTQVPCIGARLDRCSV